MKKHTSIQLTKRLLNRVKTGTTDEVESELTEPANIFYDKLRAEAEQQLFLNTPQVIGFAGQVQEPDSFFTTDVAGIPVVVTRDAQGAIRAFINACAHKGARIANGNGCRKKLVCKFHGWSYSMDGTLYGRPKDHSFETAGPECNLQSLPVSTTAGLIVVGLKPDIPQNNVDTALDDIREELVEFEFDKMHFIETREFTVNANWKLVAGLSHEAYHFSTLHRNTVAQALYDNAVFDTFTKHSRWAFPLKSITRLNDLNESEWPRHIEGAVNHTLFPGNTVLITSPPNAQMIRVQPGDTPASSRVFYTGVCQKIDKIDDARKSYAFGGDVFEQEDLPIAEECQQGLAARQSTFIIGKNEPVVQFWHKLWNQLLE